MPRRALPGLALAGLLALLAPGLRAELNPFAPVLRRTLPGGLAAAATCINNADPAEGGPTGGVLELSELPPEAEIQEAWLYWSVLSDTTPVPTGAPTLDGIPLQVMPVGEVARTPCFDQQHTGIFKADVSTLVTGNGSHRLAGFLGTGTVAGDLTEGATLFVLYCAGSGVETDIVLYEGVDVTQDGTDRVVQDIEGFLAGPAAPVAARLVVAAGNGQGRPPSEGPDPDPFVFNGVDLDEADPTILSGALCPPLGLYDLTELDVTGLIEPGATSAHLEIGPEGDCHSFGALALAVATVPGAVLPEPSALDLRPGATPLRVTRAPGGLAVGWEDLGPGITYDLYRGRVGAWYDHGPFGSCSLAAPRVEIPEEAGSRYFLAVTAGCGGAESAAGRDSRGVRRPSAREASGASCP